MYMYSANSGRNVFIRILYRKNGGKSTANITAAGHEGKKHAKYYSFMVNYANWLK